MRSWFLLMVLVVSLLVVFGCRGDLSAPDSSTAPQSAVVPEGPNNPPPGGTPTTVELPAGSVDALADAIAAAGSGGKVIVKSGMHTESSGVVISAPVSILGEPGAVLVVTTTPDPDFPSTVDAALYIKNTSRVRIDGLEILPSGPIGNTAIYIENTKGIRISNNTIREYQVSVLNQFGDHTRIDGNQIFASLAWLTGEIAESDGIIAMNGSHVHITNNMVTNAVLGIFPSGPKGYLSGNVATGNFIGIILCNVPPESFELPDGSLVGSTVSATGWQASNNTAHDNFDAGYMVIDGANNNNLANNAAWNNGTYDIDLVGPSLRFGFPTPTCFENRVEAGQYQDILIKDCGENNQIHGGILVDNDVDPCF